MAGFCTKCGTTMPSTTGFCPACGAPAGAGAAAPQAVVVPAAAPVAPGYAPVSTPVAYPPTAAGYPPAAGYPAPGQQKSGGALKIILIIIAVVIGLGLLAVGGFAFWGYRVAHQIASSVQTDNKGNSTVSMLGGSIQAGKDIGITASQLGVDLYPGATRAEGGMNMTLPTGSMVSAVYVTDDPVSTVVAFYKGKLGANESDIDTDNGSVLSSGQQGSNNKSGTVITIAPGTGNNNGKTQISIVHTTSTQ
jgi:hypothetical protein